MKIFSKYINEQCTTADINPGNSLMRTGVSNHITPIGNIVTNVKNLFAARLGVVASVAEDGVSIKLNSSNFTDKKQIEDILYNSEIMRGTCLASYIMSQGLDLMKTVSIGQFYVVYFCPRDIMTAMPGVEPEQASLPCKEMTDFNLQEAEMIIIREDAEEELADVTKEKLSEILKMTDKVKAAKQLELLVNQDMELPRDYYFAGVKDKAGNESIALRWKFIRSGGKGQTVEITKSLINIYDETDDGVWVSDFAEDALVELPEEVETLIKNVLEFIGAGETDKKGVYSLTGESSKKSDKDEDKDDDKDDDKDSDKKDDEKSDDKKDDEKSNDSDDKKDDEKSDDKKDDKNKKDDIDADDLL